MAKSTRTKTIFSPSVFPWHRFKNICVQTDPSQHNSTRYFIFQAYRRRCFSFRNSPQTERKRRSMRIKLERCLQIGSRRYKRWKAKLEGCGDDIIDDTIQTNTQGLCLRIFSPWDQVSESYVFRQCVRLDDQPK